MAALALLKTSYSAAILICGACGLLALLIWFLAKRRMQKIRLPTLRVLTFNTKKLPKFVFILPPWIPFICFLLTLLALLFFSLKPFLEDRQQSQTARLKSLFLIDLSPSVSTVISDADYRRLIEDWFQKLHAFSDIEFLLSGQNAVSKINDLQHLQQALAELQFHKAGTKLGSMISKVHDQGHQYDRFFIFSDRDRHSWEGFNWKFLTAQSQVFFVPVSSGNKNTSNIFLRSLAPADSSRDDSIRGIDVYLGRSLAQGEVKGNLNLYLEQDGRAPELIAKSGFAFPDGTERVNVVLTGNLAGKLESHEGEKELGKRSLRFEIQPDQADNMTLDNLIELPWTSVARSVVLVGGYQGERFLFDPTYDLQMSLNVLGFDVKRYDAKFPKLTSFRNWLNIVMVEPEQAANQYCPNPVTLQEKASSTANDKTVNHGDVQPVFWFVPTQVQGNFADFCSCIVDMTQGTEAPDKFCDGATSVAEWGRILRSMGGNQFGGRISKDEEALAWTFPPERNRFAARITVFLTPLRATPFGVFTKAGLSLLIKDLVGMENMPLLNPLRELHHYAIDDIGNASALQKTKDQSLNGINVPLGESMLQSIDSNLLPPQLMVAIPEEAKTRDEDRKENVLPVVTVIILLCLGLFLVESAYHLWLKFAKVAIGLTLLGGVIAANTGQAQVSLAVLGYEEGQVNQRLYAMEVENRTSIEMSESLRNYGRQVQTSIFKEPWLWVSDLDLLKDKKGALDSRFQLWLRRGGFLILDGSADIEKLKQLMAFQDGALTGQDGWGPIPPDHEIMRSFYLLDTLPTCNSKVWYGYQFDGRLAILASPYSLLASSRSAGARDCAAVADQELSIRTLINIIMVALATDYKKDQIHLPEILKRLRL